MSLPLAALSWTAQGGESSSDRALAAQVESALRARIELHAEQIEVEVKAGVAELSGYASSSTQISQAVDVAGSVPGVKEVRNELRLKTEP